ncbi:MAG: hypothetical protein HY350_04680 [Candidatus Omnitrophica bacterium]|nr:hypothetical protein [Candidatus Omnitrophota bacterium]
MEKIKGRIKEIERFITEAELIRKTTALEEKVARLASPPEENLPPPAAAGIIEDLGGIINRPAAHKLIIDGKMAYYLKSQAVDLNKFIYQKVLIWGQISQPEKNLLPVITVEKIKPAVE